MNFKTYTLLTATAVAGILAFAPISAHADELNQTISTENTAIELALVAQDNEAIDIANEAIQITRSLRDYLTLNEQKTYTLPIKIAAGRLWATANARGSYSATLNHRLTALLNSLKSAQKFAEDHMEIDATFDLMVQMTALQERISAELE